MEVENHMIKCSDLTIRYGDTVAVDQLNMSINAGEAIALVGESGCGKTSLLHTIAGLLKPFEGGVTIYNQPIKDRRKGTAIILQNDGLFPWKNVYDNVAIGLLSRRMEKSAVDNKVMRVLEELGIEAYKDDYLKDISGGQRQRVAIARALVQGPDLLLMDEPTGALDMVTKEKFQESLHELYQRHPMTSLLVTHDIEEAVYLGMKVIVMQKGQIKAVIDNPYYGMQGLRDDLRFYELCLKVRQVMKS